MIFWKINCSILPFRFSLSNSPLLSLFISYPVHSSPVPTPHPSPLTPPAPLLPCSSPSHSSPQVPDGSVPHGAPGGDGLGLDRHHAVPVQLDLRGRHLRQHLHPQVLEGVGEGEWSAFNSVPLNPVRGHGDIGKARQSNFIYIALFTHKADSKCLTYKHCHTIK